MSWASSSTVSPNPIAIGIHMTEAQVEQVKEKLQEKNIKKIDTSALIQVLHIHKDM